MIFFYLYNVKIEPLTPSIFMYGFSHTASYNRRDQETFHLNEGKPILYTHALKLCGKIV